MPLSRRELLLGSLAVLPAAPSEYWALQRRGANCFNKVLEPEWFAAAQAAGIALVRLAPDKWSGSGRDFLLGNADNYAGIPEPDLARLRSTLDRAHATGIRVILTMLSLPGARWRQNNGNRFDFRLWRDAAFHRQAERFWRDLAGALRGHPALAGYNLLNEPWPERAFALSEEHEAQLPEWRARVAGTPADLNLLYRRLAAAVRAADPETTLVLDAGLFASPYAIEGLEPIEDRNTLYAVHMYEPYRYTNWRQNGGKLRYPFTGGDRAALEAILGRVKAWQARHRLPSSRLLLGEFGCDRRAPGAAAYLADVIAIANRERWHWCFYAFREDEWDAMDYEIGPGPLGQAWWQARERNPRLAPPRDPANPLWQVIRRGLQETGTVTIDPFSR